MNYLKEVANIDNKKCIVILDLDETIFNPLEKWRKHLVNNLGVDFSVSDVEKSGGLDSLFESTPRYAEFTEIAERYRANPELYLDLPLIEGAVSSIQKIEADPDLIVGGYLTARPKNIIDITIDELRKNNLPIRPIIARPTTIKFLSTVEWKIDVLNDVNIQYPQSIIMVDDKLELALELKEENQQINKKPITTILFKGPLSLNAIQQLKIVSDPATHFYVSDWQEIPSICKKYTG